MNQQLASLATLTHSVPNSEHVPVRVTVLQCQLSQVYPIICDPHVDNRFKVESYSVQCRSVSCICTANEGPRSEALCYQIFNWI